MSKIKIEQQKDGRWFAQYFCFDKTLDGIGQFGKTPLEAQVNLQALINAVKKRQLRTMISLKSEV